MEAEDLSLIISNAIRKREFSSSNIGPIFDSLKIPYKKGRNFWLANEAELEYLYDDFCKVSRNVLKELHPDVGGDTEEFQNFSGIVGSVKKSFWKKGIGKDITLFKALEKEEKPERYQRKTGRRSYSRVLDGLDELADLEKLSLNHNDLNSSPDSVTFTPIERVRKNRRATLARERRKRNKKKFREYLRERYQRLKAEGRLPKQDLEKSRRYYRKHRTKLRNAGRRYREENKEKVLQWKRNHYWRKKGFAEPPEKIKKPKKRGLYRRICERCKEKYKPKTRVEKYCGRKCYRAAKSQRRLQRLKSIPKPEKIIPSRTCELEGCNTVFQPTDSRQIYCCKQHGTKAANTRRTEKCRAEKPIYERQCDNSKCNKPFTTTHSKQIYCSERCAHNEAQRKFRRNKLKVPLDKFPKTNIIVPTEYNIDSNSLLELAI